MIRAGLLWSIEVPRDSIVAIESVAPPFPDRAAPDYLRITGLADPNLLLTLRDRAPAEGLYGRRKMVSRIGIAADHPADLLRAVQALADANA